MKQKLLLIAFLLFGLNLFAQTDPYIFDEGSTQEVRKELGGRILDSLLVIPVRGHDALYPDAPLLGRFQLNSNDSIPEFHNGNYWITVKDYVTPEMYGAIGDDDIDDSAALQSAFNSGNPNVVIFREYIGNALEINDSINIIGLGVKSIIKTTSNDTLISIKSSGVSISNLTIKGTGRGSAGNYLSDNPNQVGINVNGEYYGIKLTNINYKDLGGVGFYGKENSDGISTTVRNGVLHDGCNFDSCLYGVKLDTLFEYSLFDNCNFQLNEYGVEIGSGNNSITGGSIITNRTGLKLSAGSNDGHSVLIGTTINHNLDYGIDASGITNGYLFSDLVVFFNAIRIVNCTDMVFNGGLFKNSSGYPFTITNCTRTTIQGIKHEVTPTYTITGDTPRFFNNSYPSSIPAAAVETITALTNTNIFTIDGSAASSTLLRMRITGTNRFLIGSDAAITAGNANDLNVYVSGNNSLFFSRNNIKVLSLTPTATTFSTTVSSNPAPTTGDHLTNKTYVDAADALKAPLANPTFTTNVTSPKFTLSALNTAPSSATDTGTTGEIRIDAGYIYVCIASNTWVRSALTTW